MFNNLSKDFEKFVKGELAITVVVNSLDDLV